MRYDIYKGEEIASFNAFCTATKPIPAAASGIHSLYLIDGIMMKKTGESFSTVEAHPSRITLTNFLKWVFNYHSEVKQQQVLLGYNNFAFDDHCLIHHITI